MAVSITPAAWAAMINEGMTFANYIQNQGAVELIQAPDISKKSTLWHYPKYYPLTAIIPTATTITSSTTLTPDALTDYDEIYPVVHRGGSFTIKDINVKEQGYDPIRELLPQVSTLFTRWIQTSIAAAVVGAFGTALNTTHSKDSTGFGINSMLLYETPQELLGEVGINLNTVMMHSKIYKDLQADIKQDLTTLENGATLVQRWLGDKRVLINDTICATKTVNDKTAYPTYIFSGQPFKVGYQAQTPPASEREEKSFKTDYVMTVDYAVGIKGVSWNTTGAPTDAELDDAAKWTKVASSAGAIELVELLTI
jgi:hypothetical protein